MLQFTMDPQGRKRFLQSLVSRGTVTLQEAEQLVQECFPDGGVSLSDCSAVLNDMLRPLQLEINRSRRDEVTGDHLVGLINTSADEAATKFGAPYTKAELEFFQKMTNHLMEHGSEKSTVLINKATSMEQTFSTSQAQDTFVRLCSAGWLQLQGSMCMLGPRSRVEIVTAQAADLDACKSCHDPIVYGKTCASCGQRWHVFCLKDAFQFDRRCAGKEVCPACLSPWTDALEEPSHSQTQSTMEQAVASLSPKKPLSSRRRRPPGANDDDDGNGAASANPREATASASRSTRSTRRSRVSLSSQMEQEDDDDEED
eukprot:m.355851 g.355851  ORF g.355851 m.355851 type:complete len:314 (-) comp17358_c0_seq1:1566-2507(-)